MFGYLFSYLLSFAVWIKSLNEGRNGTEEVQTVDLERLLDPEALGYAVNADLLIRGDLDSLEETELAFYSDLVLRLRNNLLDLVRRLDKRNLTIY